MAEGLTLEERVAKLERAAEHDSLLTATLNIMQDEVVMPALLLLAGQGYRDRLRTLLERAEMEIEAQEPLPAKLHQFELGRIHGWLRATSAVPDWWPMQLEEREPDQ